MSSREPVRRRYTIHGTAVDVTTSQPAITDWLATFLSYLGLDPVEHPEGDPHVAIVLGTGQVQQQLSDASWRSVSGTTLELFEGGNTTAVRSGDDLALIDQHRCRAEVAVDPSRGTDANLISYVLLTLLRRRDLYPVHAAGVVRDERALLLVGDSGAGKSTLTVRLLDRGWRLLSDDSLLLTPETEGVLARTLRRDLFLLPEEGESLITAWPEPAKRKVDVRESYSGQLVRCGRPTTLVFPVVAPTAKSRLEPCTAAEALHLLTHHSLVAELERGRASRHLHTLSALVGQCSHWRLEAGRDIVDDPGCAHRMLRPILEGFAQE